ncbi:MAG: hypothetical protein LBU61_03160 [Coriobacteriales bacterium]|jgi:hypothetical protein|nr:hypothetical protein [Coriobacteriales bacterium]
MINPVFEKNLELVHSGMKCLNDKPLTCMTGTAFGAVLDGMTVAQFIADPVEGGKAAIRTIKRLEEEAGPIHSFNFAPNAMNMAVSITFSWNSRVLIPGIDIPDDSVWQVKEQQLIDRDAYDEIMATGYNEFIQTQIFPRIIDQEYLAKYMRINAEHQPEFDAIFADWGIPVFRGAPGARVPFEPLCGMRSMLQFYKDCYKIPDKIKAVSDFVFAELTAQAEVALAAYNNPIVIGNWVGGWRTASALVNQTIFDELVWPYMKAAAEQLIRYGKIAVMHLDSEWNRDIERFGELPQGMAILNTDAMTDLPRARQLLPNMPLMGDVSPALLATGSPQQVADYVKRLIDSCGPAGMFICPGCDTPINARFENMAAMLKATNEWS